MSTIAAKQIHTTVSATKLDTSGTLPSMTVSTSIPDRDNDRVLPQGGDFQHFLRNPVLCWGHSHSDLPIGTVTQLASDATGVRMQWKWLHNDAFADRVRNAYEQGVVRAASIGFIPQRSVRNEYGGEDHREWELIEISLVSVPANPQAVRTLKSLGLWDERGQDDEGLVDWRSINKSSESEIDWDGINASAASRPQVSIDSRLVDAMIDGMLPALFAGVLTIAARDATQAAINRLTGRLD